VGAGHFFFLAPVSKAMKQTYVGLYPSKNTTDRAIVESANRLNWTWADLSPEHLSPLVLGEHGSMEIIYAALALGIPRSADICMGLARSGRCATVQLMHKQYHCLLSGDVAVALAEAGDLDGVKYVSDHISFLKQTECALVEAAAAGGHIHILQWAHEHSILADGDNAAYAAARRGHVETIKWLQTADAISHIHNPYLSAAEAGNYEAFTCFHTATCDVYSREGPCECMSEAFEAVELQIAAKFVEGESKQILEYVRDHAPEHMWTTLVSYCMEEACGVEKFELAQWCLQQGAEWMFDGIVDLEAAEHYPECNPLKFASAESVAWAIAHECGWGDWDNAVCQRLLSQDKGAIVQWAHSSGCPCACVR
jgi:hypothetical protein